MSWQHRIAEALQTRRQQQRLRQRSLLTPDGAGWLRHEGQRYRNFASNDYLGLSDDARIIDARQQGAARYGIGAGASGHVTAIFSPMRRWRRSWPTGSAIRARCCSIPATPPTAVIGALAAQDDRILADKLSHASLLEAASLSPATLRRFAHNQPESLHRLLASPVGGETLVVTEGVFSMDGDSAPLSALHQLTRQAGGWLLVDDAHGVGVQGEQGRGSCWQQDVRPELLIVTFGKAFGVSGAALLCDRQTADYLLQFARHLIYSTAMPPAQAEALRAALQAVQQGDDLRARLAENIARFRHGARQLGSPDAVKHCDSTADRRRGGAGARFRQPSAGARLLGDGDPSADGAARHGAAAHHPDGAPYGGRY